MKLTRINPVDIGLLSSFHSKMVEWIFRAKYKDGQKGKKTYEEIGLELQRQELKSLKRKRAYIRSLEKLNMPPMLLKMRNTAGIIDEYKTFQSAINPPKYETHDLFGTGPITGIINSSEVLEEHHLFSVIRKWYEINERKQPNENNLKHFYFDEAFELNILDIQRNKIQEGKIDEILDLNQVGIYYYKTKKRKSHRKLKRIKKKFYNTIVKEKRTNSKLHLDQQFSDRSSIISEYYALFEVDTRKKIYEFYSRHFEFYFNSLVELNQKKPHVFGKGANLLLQELHKYILSHPRCPVKYLTDFDLFKLSLQRTFGYIGDEEKGLRIDLFRNIRDEEKSGKNNFEGGLFYILRHFQRFKVPLSSYNEGGEEFDTENFFGFIASGFFHHSFSKDPKTRNDFLSSNVNYDLTGNPYQFVFYSNPNSPGLYYLTNIYREKRK